MSKKSTNKIALVTGGSRGLGKAVSLALANEGATVIVNYANNSDNAEKTVKEIQQNGGQAISLQADITNEDNVQRLVLQAKERLGRSIDILVNNATGPQPEVSIEESTWEIYLDQLHFFVKAPLLLTKAILPDMKAKKQEGLLISAAK